MYRWPFPESEVVLACYSPLMAWYGRSVNPTGKRSLVFKRELAQWADKPLRLPCGGCVGCRLERARQWAVRCMHEKRVAKGPSHFVTLSYSDDELPETGSLCKRDLQLFMKRLRKKYGEGIRFFAAGEYGSTTLRPHYHALLFNLRLGDLKQCKTAKRGEPLYKSLSIEGVWQHGQCWIGAVTLQSCQYVARYICDKITGDLAETHYLGREPEFVLMSRRPGIGKEWFDLYAKESFRHDNCVVDGRVVRLPRYYDTKFEGVDPVRLAEVKVARACVTHRPHVKAEQTPDRRRVRESVVTQNLNRFRRDVT